ncbi:acyl-CoA dehydrogenase family protein [Advenella kashmirensis]
MNFSLSDDHLFLRDAANTFLHKEVNLAPLLLPGATIEQAGYEDMWSKIAELGWPGIIIPENYGGLGMSMVDLAMILSECGRFLAPSPMFGTLSGSWAILAAGSEAQKRQWLPDVAAGNLILALGIAGKDGNCEIPDTGLKIDETENGYRLNGDCHYVVDAASAEKIVVAALYKGVRRFFLVDRTESAVEITTLDWRDITRQVCSIKLLNAPAELLGGASTDVWPWIRDRLYLALAAESSGGLHAVLDDTVAYAKDRVAFGRPIGAYQAIKHSLADMLAEAEFSSVAVLYAAWALSSDDSVAPLTAAMAQSYASDAYRNGTARSIQIFGAIGFTWEMKNHLYFKRARANAELLGSPQIQREQIVQMLEKQNA